MFYYIATKCNTMSDSQLQFNSAHVCGCMCDCMCVHVCVYVWFSVGCGCTWKCLIRWGCGAFKRESPWYLRKSSNSLGLCQELLSLTPCPCVQNDVPLTGEESPQILANSQSGYVTIPQMLRTPGFEEPERNWPWMCLAWNRCPFPYSSVGKESACNAVRFLGWKDPLEKG